MCFVHDRRQYSSTTRDHRQQHFNTLPGIARSPPAQSQQEARDARDEGSHAYPVSRWKRDLRHDNRRIPLQAERHGNQSDATKGQVDVEQPEQESVLPFCSFVDARRNPVYHLQSCSASTAPSIGATQVPSPKTSCITPRYLARSRRGIRSANIIRFRLIMPPPPTPCMVRPASIWTTLDARQHVTLPTVNISTAAEATAVRPQRSAMVAMMGWQQALASR